MPIRFYTLLITIIFFLPLVSTSQNIEKISYDHNDAKDGYYLAIRPQSTIKGVVVLLTSFLPPETILPETKLQNVAYANDILAVVANMERKLYADSSAVARLNMILEDIVKRYSADTSKFALSGYDEAGNIALRYTELTCQHPENYLVHPKVVFGINTPVDLFGLWHWSERQIRKNYWQGSVGDARYYLDAMTKENGTIYNNTDRYKMLTPFCREDSIAGNEQYLKNVAVRLYYDTDIDWQLKNRRNSIYDTNIPDGSELINRLLLSGNHEAEFVASRLPGMQSNGIRHPNSLSIVDEVDCIQWIKRELNIFDANTWVPTYNLMVPQGWGVERFSLPADFAPHMIYKGVEDLRFTPGWGDEKSDTYWSYAYLWWLKGTSAIDAGNLQESLNEYYTGLIGRNIISRKIPDNKLVPVTVTIKKIETSKEDRETYKGTVSMLDYMSQQPIVLHLLIHIKNCASQNQAAVIVLVSPNPSEHKVWKEFDEIVKNFQCNK